MCPPTDLIGEAPICSSDILLISCPIIDPMHDFDSRVDFDSLTLLKYKDFVPEQVGPKSIWTNRREIEPLQYALQDANAWILDHPEIEILNVETVTLPNIHSKWEDGSEDPDLLVTGGASAAWNQFFRIWYMERKTTSDS